MKAVIQLLGILFFGLISAQAQVNFEAEASRDKLGLNERLKVEFTIDKDGDNFRAPDFKNFKRLAGPNQSISQSWVNGKSSFKKTYTYFLEPEKKGKLTIGQAEIEVNGKVYKTSPIDVEVTSAVDQPNSAASRAESQVSDAIHLVAEVSKSKPYLNEGIYVVYKLFIGRNVNIRNFRPIDDPKFKDFWNQNIDIDELELKEGEYAGEPYQYVELRRTILYPQKTGELIIEPATYSLSVEVPTNRRDIFGRRQYEMVERKVSTKTRKIEVKPLPNENKPADFSGAVGQFDFDVKLSKNEIIAQESLSATVEVKGKGNLELFSLPKLKTPSKLEVYDPERNKNVRVDARGMRGSISEKYTIVPQQKGKYPISSINFTYFDPKSESYKSISSNELLLDVKPNPNQEKPATDSVVASEEDQHKQRVVTPDMQFEYIQLKTNLKQLASSAFFKSRTFWILFLLPFLLIPILILVVKKFASRFEVKSDQKQKKANKLAKKYLSEAKQKIGDQEHFFEALERALHNYLKAKLSITTAEMSKPKIKEILSSKNVSQEVISDFIKVLENCEFARYTPSSNQAMQDDYDKAVAVIAKMDKNL
ncbi:MAG: BatD family protein [Bacteroidota bacterium]